MPTYSTKDLFQLSLPTPEEQAFLFAHVPASCDNRLCSTTTNRNILRRCSGCNIVSALELGQLQSINQIGTINCFQARYCSKDCQKMDWCVFKIISVIMADVSLALHGRRSNHKAFCTKNKKCTALTLAERCLGVPVLIELLITLSIRTLRLTEVPVNANDFVVQITCRTIPIIHAIQAPSPPADGYLLSVEAVEAVPVLDAPERVQILRASALTRMAEHPPTVPGLIITIYFCTPDGKSADGAVCVTVPIPSAYVGGVSSSEFSNAEFLE